MLGKGADNYKLLKMRYNVWNLSHSSARMLHNNTRIAGVSCHAWIAKGGSDPHTSPSDPHVSTWPLWHYLKQLYTFKHRIRKYWTDLPHISFWTSVALGSGGGADLHTSPSIPPTSPSIPPTSPSIPPTSPSIPPTSPSIPPTSPSIYIPPTSPSIPRHIFILPTSEVLSTHVQAPGPAKRIRVQGIGCFDLTSFGTIIIQAVATSW